VKYRRYPAYRPSRVEWLGDIPAHWDVVALKRAVDLRAGEAITADDFTDAGAYPVFGGNGIRGFTDAYTHEGEFVLVGRQGALCGNVNIARGKFWASEHAVVAAPREPTATEWLAGLLQTMDLNQHSLSAAQPGLAVERIRELAIPQPPLSEQFAIANFLKRETARIDALIEKKGLLIERLEEQRTVLTSRVVTRGLPSDAARAAGLDPSPRLKPSGVAWLGDVPEHWEVMRNRWSFSERDERSDDGDGELLTVSHITGVTRRSDKPDVGMFLAESLEGYKTCRTGDLVINTMWAWMGAAGCALEDGLVSPSYNVYAPNERLLPRFIDYTYRSRPYITGMTSESKGVWSSRLRLYPHEFMSLVTAVPPLEEQNAIVSYLDDRVGRGRLVAGRVSEAVERLREYRAGLITAVVTGKIDIRSEAPLSAYTK
jgi:type I restriction enzyme, S subunit